MKTPTLWTLPLRLFCGPLWLRLLLSPFVVIGLIIAIPISLIVSLLASTILRRRCPHCERRGLRGGLLVRDDSRRYFFSECDYCHYQFEQARDQTDQAVIQIAPTDARYIRET